MLFNLACITAEQTDLMEGSILILLQKVNKKLYLSKVKFAKFNESGQLASFYLCSFAFGANLLYEVSIM